MLEAQNIAHRAEQDIALLRIAASDRALDAQIGQPRVVRRGGHRQEVVDVVPAPRRHAKTKKKGRLWC